MEECNLYEPIAEKEAVGNELDESFAFGNGDEDGAEEEDMEIYDAEFESLVATLMRDMDYIGINQSAANLAYAIINAGLISLPVAAYKIGMPLFLTAVITMAVLTSYISVMIISMANEKRVKSLEDLASVVGGPRMFCAVSFFQILLSSSMMCITLDVWADVMSDVFSAPGWDTERSHSWYHRLLSERRGQVLVGAVIVLPLCLFKHSMVSLRWTSFASVFVIAACLVALSCAYVVEEDFAVDDPIELIEPKTNWYAIFFVLMFCYSYNQRGMAVYRCLRQRNAERWKAAVRKANMGVSIVYIVFGICGYFAAQKENTPLEDFNFFINRSPANKLFFDIVRITVVSCLLLTIPVDCLIATSTWRRAWKKFIHYRYGSTGGTPTPPLHHRSSAAAAVVGCRVDVLDSDSPSSGSQADSHSGSQAGSAGQRSRNSSRGGLQDGAGVIGTAGGATLLNGRLSAGSQRDDSSAVDLDDACTASGESRVERYDDEEEAGNRSVGGRRDSLLDGSCGKKQSAGGRESATALGSKDARSRSDANRRSDLRKQPQQLPATTPSLSTSATTAALLRSSVGSSVGSSYGNRETSAHTACEIIEEGEDGAEEDRGSTSGRNSLLSRRDTTGTTGDTCADGVWDGQIVMEGESGGRGGSGGSGGSGGLFSKPPPQQDMYTQPQSGQQHHQLQQQQGQVQFEDSNYSGNSYSSHLSSFLGDTVPPRPEVEDILVASSNRRRSSGGGGGGNSSSRRGSGGTGGAGGTAKSGKRSNTAEAFFAVYGGEFTRLENGLVVSAAEDSDALLGNSGGADGGGNGAAVDDQVARTPGADRLRVGFSGDHLSNETVRGDGTSAASTSGTTRAGGQRSSSGLFSARSWSRAHGDHASISVGTSVGTRPMSGSRALGRLSGRSRFRGSSRHRTKLVEMGPSLALWLLATGVAVLVRHWLTIAACVVTFCTVMLMFIFPTMIYFRMDLSSDYRALPLFKDVVPNRAYMLAIQCLGICVLLFDVWVIVYNQFTNADLVADHS